MELSTPSGRTGSRAAGLSEAAPDEHARSARVPGWFLLNVAALSSVLAHTFIDHHLGLYGEPSPAMSPLQATEVAVTCLLVAWWVICLSAASGTARPGLSGALGLALVWAFLANGLAAFIAAPPPADAFPYQDLTHLASAVFGALATVMTWWELRRSRTSWSWRWAGVATVGMAGLFAAQSVLSTPNL